MAKTIKFKNPESNINIGGQIIAPHNLTVELYDYLVKLAPAHADLFDVTDEPVKPVKPTVVEK